MSSSQFSQKSGQDDREQLTICDEYGRSLDCYIENSIELDSYSYYLLIPCNYPVMIITGDNEDLEDEDDEFETEEILILEEKEEIDGVFPDAKAVLSELNLILHDTAYTLTITGDLPDLEEDDLLTLEMDEENEETEELQWLASFYSNEQKYSVCAPINPLLYVGEEDSDGKIRLMSMDDPELQDILNELLFDSKPDW